MNLSITRGSGFGFGAAPASVVGSAVGGLGEFSAAAYQRADQIRRSLQTAGGAVPAAPGAAAGVTSAIAGFIASPAGHAALERLAAAGSAWFERALGVATVAEQLPLPLA